MGYPENVKIYEARISFCKLREADRLRASIPTISSLIGKGYSYYDAKCFTISEERRIGKEITLLFNDE